MMNNLTQVLNTSSNNTSLDANNPSWWIDFLPNILVTIVGIMAIIINGILLLAIFRNASIIFQYDGSYLVTNVAVADLLTGIFSLFYGITGYIELDITAIQERVVHALFWTSVEASLITVFVMSLVRYLTIVHPLHSQRWLSYKVPSYSCILVWLISLCCGILVTLYNDITKFILAVLFEIVTLATVFLYYKIFLTLAQRNHLVPVPVASSGSPPSRLIKDLKREYQLTSVVVVLTVIMVITVLPYMIVGQIYISYILFSLENPPQGLMFFVTYYFPVELTNFVLNPVVYAWRLPKYRRALMRTFKPFLRSSKPRTVRNCNHDLTY